MKFAEKQYYRNKEEINSFKLLCLITLREVSRKSCESETNKIIIIPGKSSLAS